MLYLEDYLEMIENLPMEMRDRFTEMREMDLQVENAMDSLDEKVKGFFKKCGTVPNLKQEWKDEQMAKIKQEYQKALEDADEKVQLANQMYDLVERHLRKLDQEVAKFKMELEADNSGITEVLERRAMESEKPIPQMSGGGGVGGGGMGVGGITYKAEKRKYSSLRLPGFDRVQSVPADLCGRDLQGGSSYSGVLSNKSGSSTTSSPAGTMFESTTAAPMTQKVTSSTAVNYNLGQVGSGSNAAIAVAASRAIGATLEMQQGRRSASLKASYEAVSKNFHFTKDMSLNNRGDDVPTTITKIPTPANKLSSVDSTSGARQPSKKKSSTKASATSQRHQQQQQQQQQQQRQSNIPLGTTMSTSDLIPSTLDPLLSSRGGGEEVGGSGGGAAGTSGGTMWNVDPNEPRYCICNDVSYGDMVGCDNEDCPQEWFHYACVGLVQAPRGKWYCPSCLSAMKRRGGRK